jgi:hypothetical protein
VRIRVTLISVVFGLIAAGASLLALDRTQLMVQVTSSGSVSDIVLPFGFWALAAIWMLAAIAMRVAPAREVIYRGVVAGFALHALLLVALFVPRLADREAFSSGIYLIYARLFCVAALAVATAWSIGWVRRSQTDRRAIMALDAPVVIGALALAAVLSRSHITMAAAGIVGGIVLAAVLMGRAGVMLGAIAGDERVFLGAVVLIALGLRLMYVNRIMGDPNYLDTGADGRIYDTLAWSLASGGGIPASFTQRYPLLLLGYVWFLAAIYRIAGHSYLIAVMVQSILGAAVCVLVYAAVKQVFDAVTARVVAAFIALNFSLIFAAAALGHQALDVFLTALIVLMLIRAIARPVPAWRWMAIGLVVGATIAVRETAVFFAGFVLLWIAFAGPHGWRAARPALVAFAAGIAIVVLPLAAPKVLNSERRAELRTHFDRLYRGQAEAQPVRGDLVGPLADPSGALAQLEAHPIGVAATLARAYTRNFAVQFLTQPYGGFDLVFLRKGSAYYYGLWFYAYTLTIIGTIVAVRMMLAGGPAASGVALMLGLIAARTLPHIVLESDYRHRVPIEPFLIALASLGAVSIVREVMATAANASTSGLTGSDWRVSHSSGT